MYENKASTETPVKQERYVNAIRYLLALHKVTAGKKGIPFTIIDSTCGNGYTINIETGLEEEGSPLLAWDELQKADIDFQQLFIDISQEAIDELMIRLPKADVICGDCLDVLSSLNNGYLRGLLYHDPFGMPRYEALKIAAEKWKYLDMVLNLPATTIKRNFFSSEAGAGEFKQVYRMKSLLCDLKRHWLLSESQGAMQWCMLIGLNWAKYKDWKKAGFHGINTAEGQAILQKIHYTRDGR